MPTTATLLGWLLSFVVSFLTAAAKAYIVERQNETALQNQGAAAQRAVDAAAEAIVLARAKEIADAPIDAGGLDGFVNSWVRPG
jgi:hypothetical protein